MADPGELDRTDRRLLELLAGDGRMSMTELSERVHLSRPATQARVRRLEEQGTIRGYHADIHLPFSTRPHRALLMTRLGVRPCAPALAYLRSLPEVRGYWSVAGPIDAVVEVEVHDAEALSAFIDKLSAAPFGIEVDTMTVLSDFTRGA
ncbi:Lrp/AsnC family transcriptional regulator [Phaeovulum sp.]|uniref:Lrp/AsnC family transcriptional regulator n=1 Tax=Phaeovulum sp. TaxID=2934796 RepID=UPI00356133B0